MVWCNVSLNTCVKGWVSVLAFLRDDRTLGRQVLMLRVFPRRTVGLYSLSLSSLFDYPIDGFLSCKSLSCHAVPLEGQDIGIPQSWTRTYRTVGQDSSPFLCQSFQAICYSNRKWMTMLIFMIWLWTRRNIWFPDLCNAPPISLNFSL